MNVDGSAPLAPLACFGLDVGKFIGKPLLQVGRDWDGVAFTVLLIASVKLEVLHLRIKVDLSSGKARQFALQGGESVAVYTRGPRVSTRPGLPHPAFGHLLPPGGRSGSVDAC